MRIEAHLLEGQLVTYFKDTTYEEASDTRRVVTGSRYMSKLSQRTFGTFAFRYPLSVDTCVEMREAWGDALKVHRTLGDWFRVAVRERLAQVAITEQSDVELRVLPGTHPELNAYLFGDQRVTAAWVAQAYRGGGLLADEVGTGKTVGVVAGLIERQVTGPVLIVCPKISVRSVWGKEMAKHLPEVPTYLCRGNRKHREATLARFLADPSPTKVCVVVSEMLRIKALKERGRVVELFGYEYPELFDVSWAACVLDESQRLLGSLDVVKGNLAGEGLKSLSYQPNALKLAVSATPFGKGGTIDALFGTLHWLWPDEFTSRWAWLAKYFIINEERVYIRGGGGASKTVKRVGGITKDNEAKLWRELGPRVLRRTMEEVSPAHRGMKNYVSVSCEMDMKQRVQYTRFSKDAELVVDGGIVSTVGTLDYMTRARQFANGVLRMEGGRVVYTGESCKIDKLLVHLSNLEPGRKVVISSQYNEFLDVVEKRLNEEGYWSEYIGHAGTHPEGYLVRIDGSTSEAKRDAYMSSFQDGATFNGPAVTCPDCQVGRARLHGARCPRRSGPNVFLLNSQAGGVSITLDAAEEMHQLDRMYPPEANTQLYGRIFRRGRVHEVLYYMYESMGTIDEEITAKTEAGHQEQMRVLDGRRGKEYVRKLAQYKEEL